MKKLILFFGLLLPMLGQAQSYSIDWYKIASGGGISTGGVYNASGTIGQHDASGAMTGNSYSLGGGFWSLYALQTPGAPPLNIALSNNVVTVYWQNVAGWNLIHHGNLTTPIVNWTTSASPILAGGTNYLSVTNPPGNLFFRLKNP